MSLQKKNLPTWGYLIGFYLIWREKGNYKKGEIELREREIAVEFVRNLCSCPFLLTRIMRKWAFAVPLNGYNHSSTRSSNMRILQVFYMISLYVILNAPHLIINPDFIVANEGRQPLGEGRNPHPLPAMAGESQWKKEKKKEKIYAKNSEFFFLKLQNIIVIVSICLFGCAM